jgi:RHS repeat-associated protein
VEYSATANDREKYATYTRDSVTGLDYAMNRYYNSGWGRFMSPDRSPRSIRRKYPQSWNRYLYSVDDPVNQFDPTGLTNWGTVGKGVLTLGGGVLSTVGAIAVGAGSGGLALPGAVFLGITGAGGIAYGFGQIVCWVHGYPFTAHAG